MQNLNAL